MAQTSTETKDVISNLRKVYKEVRAAKKRGASSAVEEDIDLQLDVCVECEDILLLTSNVNKIVDRLADQEKSEILRFESGNLEAVRSYVELVDQITGERTCEEKVNELLNPEFTNFEETALKLEVDAPLYQHFHSLQLRGIDGTRTVWLRGKGKDQLKFIKVQVSPGSVPQISIYSLPGESYQEDLVSVKSRPIATATPAQQGSDQKAEDKDVLDYQYEYQAGDEQESFSVALGPEIHYKDYLPRRLKLLELRAKTKVSDDLYAKVDVEVNDKVQEGVVNLVNQEGSDVATLKIDEDGSARVTVPSPYNNDKEYLVAQVDSVTGAHLDMGHELRVSQSYVVKNIYRVDQSGNLMLSSEHRYGDELTVNAQLNYSEDGAERFDAMGKWKVDRESAVILKFTDIDSPNEQVWLSYERKI